MRVRFKVLLALLLVSCLVLIPASPVLASDAWWDGDWAYRKKLTIDNTASAENLANFPVLVHLDDTNIDWTKVQNAGEDIRFVDSTDVALDYEIEEWDDTNDAWIWVEVLQIDLGVDTDYIYMYYGNDTAVDGQDVAGTWNSNYVAVYHMNDETTSTILDSTSNNNDGTKKGANEPIEVAGAIGKAQQFDGTDDFINCGNIASLDIASGITVEIIVKPLAGGSGWGGYISRSDSSPYEGFNIRRYSTNQQMEFHGLGADTHSIANINDNTLGYIVGRWNGVNNEIYKDGSVADTDASSNNPDSSGKDLFFGRLSYAAFFTKSEISEARISNIARGADWIEATNLSLTEAYITFSGEENAPANPPTNLVLTQVGDNQVDITWNIGVLATLTEIRRAVGDYPADRTEGTVVYSGALEEYSDTAGDIGLEIDKYVYYYRAWCQNALGTWSAEYASAEIGGLMTNVILLGILVFFGLCLTIGGYALHRGSLAFTSMAVWMVTCVWSYIEAGGEWGIYMGLFWVSIALIITSGLEGAMLSRGEEEAEEEIKYTQAMDEALADMDENINLRKARRRENR